MPTTSTPWPEDYVTRPSRVIAPTPRQRNRRYVPLEECEALWVANKSVDHLDVGLLHGWHLNQAKVPVPPSVAEPKLDAEIRRRIWNLPEAMQLIRLKRIYKFLCSMLVVHQLLCVLFTLRGVFMHFLELTY
jgi:hypothetical protein